MHTPFLMLMPLSCFFLISGLLLLFVWVMRHTTKNTQLKVIITLLVLGVLGTVTCIFVRSRIHDDLDKNTTNSEQLSRDGRNFKAFMNPDQKRMYGSGSIIQAK